MDIKARKSKLSRYNSYVVALRKAFRILSLTAKFSVRLLCNFTKWQSTQFHHFDYREDHGAYMEVSDDVSK